MGARLTTFILLALLFLFQGQLWLGRGSLPYVWELQRKVQARQDDNAGARRMNEQLQASVADLKDGLAVVEARARLELGMIKPNEIFVQYAK